MHFVVIPSPSSPNVEVRLHPESRRKIQKVAFWTAVGCMYGAYVGRVIQKRRSL